MGKKEVKNRFVDENGFFKPSVPLPKGKISIGYLDELCEFVYYGDDPDTKKMESILGLEDYIRTILNDHIVSSMDINFIPTWSKKLEKQIQKKINHETKCRTKNETL
jgi:hypothetical protein